MVPRVYLEDKDVVNTGISPAVRVPGYQDREEEEEEGAPEGYVGWHPICF